jgi:hypothetical protein
MGVPDAFEIVGVGEHVVRLARLPIHGEEGIVGDAGGGRGGAQVVEHAAFEVDQRADHVEGQHLEVLQSHRRLLGLGPRKLIQATTQK